MGKLEITPVPSLTVLNRPRGDINTEICQVTAGGWCCWEPGVVMIQTGCEHEHLGPVGPICERCLAMCRDIARVTHTTNCERCGHSCGIVIKVMDTSEIILF